jgi:hypothetical protein
MILEKAKLLHYHCWEWGQQVDESQLFHTRTYGPSFAAEDYARECFTAPQSGVARIVRVRDETGLITNWKVEAEIEVTFSATAHP